MANLVGEVAGGVSSFCRADELSDVPIVVVFFESGPAEELVADVGLCSDLRCCVDLQFCFGTVHVHSVSQDKQLHDGQLYCAANVVLLADCGLLFVLEFHARHRFRRWAIGDRASREFKVFRNRKSVDGGRQYPVWID